MPEKVIGGGFLVPGAAEVNVPSWKEFDEAIARLWKEIGYVNENKQALWNAVNQFKREPGTDILSEFRALRDAAFTAYRQLNGPLPEGEWTAWKCIGVAGERLDAIEKRLDSIQSDAAKAFRAVIEETLHPIFQYGLEQAIQNVMAVKEENKTLREELALLRAEVDKLKATSNP